MHDQNANPNLPSESIGLDAFNLIPGAAFMLIDQPDPRIWVAEKVVRDNNFERVYVWAHCLDRDVAGDFDLATEIALNLDYCTKVALVGLVVNPGDPDDDNFGA